METKIIVELDKKKFHMLSRAILDDLYEAKAAKDICDDPIEIDVGQNSATIISNHIENTPCNKTA